MTDQYRISTHDEDPVVQFSLLEEMVRDLVLRAGENGHHIQVEIALRLARSLERDLERQMEDYVMQVILDKKLQSRWG